MQNFGGIKMADGHRQRMRERFYNEGIDSFEPHEALEMLLYFAVPRRDTNALAHSLIERFGSFHAVLEANREDLISFGLTENAAALLNMMPAFSNYYMQSHFVGTPVLSDSTLIGNMAVAKVGERQHEIFALILLNAQMRYINFEIVETGTVSSTSVSPRKVAEEVLRNNAAKVVFVHNHPGGSLRPSPDDENLTKLLVQILKTISVTVVDHIIVANGRFSSMADSGKI